MNVSQKHSISLPFKKIAELIFISKNSSQLLVEINKTLKMETIFYSHRICYVYLTHPN